MHLQHKKRWFRGHFLSVLCLLLRQSVYSFHLALLTFAEGTNVHFLCSVFIVQGGKVATPMLWCAERYFPFSSKVTITVTVFKVVLKNKLTVKIGHKPQIGTSHYTRNANELVIAVSPQLTISINGIQLLMELRLYLTSIRKKNKIRPNINDIWYQRIFNI